MKFTSETKQDRFQGQSNGASWRTADGRMDGWIAVVSEMPKRGLYNLKNLIDNFEILRLDSNTDSVTSNDTFTEHHHIIQKKLKIFEYH